jgi:hypothetical protein
METYEDTLKDIKNTSELCPGIMRDFPRIILTNARSSGKNYLLSEIDMERTCYLLSVDDMLEEIMSRRAYGYF